MEVEGRQVVGRDVQSSMAVSRGLGIYADCEGMSKWRSDPSMLTLEVRQYSEIYSVVRDEVHTFNSEQLDHNHADS